ncbi:hypothetical protein ACFV9E_09645 [Streptomyces sp. NPDC059835]|uniref:hypothetical protein n=1 Tax=Streptomyces sp. NPDC059835 TaxID=3346967 RepID=UPI003664068A
MTLLVSGCASLGSSTHSKNVVRTATPTAVGSSSNPAEALCRSLITAQDLPAGFSTPSTAAPCDDDTKLQSAGFEGQNGGLEMVSEELERQAGAEEAAARLPQVIAELNMLAHDPTEQDSAQFRDLGDEARYFTQHYEQTYWNTLYIRRGNLLICLSVTKYGPFTPSDMHLFASKAVKRTASLG